MNHRSIFATMTCVMGALLWILSRDSEAASDAGIVQLSSADLGQQAMAVIASGSLHVGLLAGPGSKYVEVRRYQSADEKLEVMVKRYEQTSLRLKDWPTDEFMHFTRGAVVITDAAGRTQTFHAGDSIVIPKGFTGDWKQLGTVEMVTLTYDINAKHVD